MTTDPFLSRLDGAWAPARAMGALGSASIEELRDHAAGFIPAAFRVDSPIRCLDVGSGAGVPGLLLAHQLPVSSWLLVDANERRCDLARQAGDASGLAGRVEVRHGRVEDLARDARFRRGFEFVVSRLFAPFEEVVECCLPLLAPGGVMVTSIAEDALPRWSTADLSRLGGCFVESWRTDSGMFVRVDGVDGLMDRYPRRSPARRREPFEG